MDITYTIMLPVLEYLAKTLGSYGWAILGLTLAVRICVWPLQSASTRSMQRMGQLQPMLKGLQEKYKDNPQLLQQKLAEFYMRNKINPLGGCLPLLVQLPILFALFATFTGPPFQDKPIPVKVVLQDPAKAGKTAVTINPTSGADSCYVSPEGKISKLVVHPGDSTLVFGKNAEGLPTADGHNTVDFSVSATQGELPAEFKPGWVIGHDPNAATMSPSGHATFPAPGEVIIEAVIPNRIDDKEVTVTSVEGQPATTAPEADGTNEKKVPVPAVPTADVASSPEAKDQKAQATAPEAAGKSQTRSIRVQVKVVPKESGNGGIFGMGGEAGPKAMKEHSAASLELSVDGKPVKVRVEPGDSTVVAGGSQEFRLRAVEGELPVPIQPLWRVAEDPNAASVNEEGKAVFRHPGEVTVQAMVPGEAKNQPFYFISGVGKVAKGMELLHPSNFDVLGLIILFGATMILSQKMMVTTPPSDPDQAAMQKQTQQIMPITVMAMFLIFPLPAGVFLYMVFSNILQTLQTWIVMKSPAAPLVEVEEGVGPGDTTITVVPKGSQEESKSGEVGEKAVKLTGDKKKQGKKR